MSFTDPEIRTIIVANYITTGFNFLGSLFTITTYILFKDARNGATSLVFCLALSDFCTACANMTTFLWVFVHIGDFPCQLQGVLLMFGLCASCLWGLMIGCYMFLVLYKNVEIETMERYGLVFQIIAWGYALVAAVTPLFKNKYGKMFPGHEFTWCWINDPHSGFRMLLYFPDTIIFVVLIILYMLTRQRLRSTQGTLANEICQKMSMYLLVYVFINLFAIINRLQNFWGHDIVFPLFLMQFLTQPLQGFLNAIAYFWNEPAFIEQYKQLFSKMTCACRSRRITLAKSIQQEETERLLRSIVYDDVP